MRQEGYLTVTPPRRKPHCKRPPAHLRIQRDPRHDRDNRMPDQEALRPWAASSGPGDLQTSQGGPRPQQGGVRTCIAFGSA
eukprot:15472024-Alexandrium_andersonii.AAC.1